MDTATLSEAAVALMRGYRGDTVVTDANRDACRELEGAGFLVPTRPFAGPPAYRLTAMGVKMIGVLGRIEPSAPSPARSASRRP